MPRKFGHILESTVGELRNEIAASSSATSLRSFAPKREPIAVNREFDILAWYPGKFHLDDQTSVFRDVNIGVGDPVGLLSLGLPGIGRKSRLSAR
jgi:hypothetical protein